MNILSKFSNQPTRYDRVRVAQLKPIRESIEHLRLPILSMRPLTGILGAIEVQIETGGDSPVVNALLLDALRAAVRHQANESVALAVFHAIDQFARAEARRWEQAEAGTLPPIELTPDERLDELMRAG